MISIVALPLFVLCTKLLRPGSADIRFDKWCDQNGIFRVAVETVTTPSSLGGRGLFATRAMKRGSVIASIPAKLVIVADDSQEGEWQISLANKVAELFMNGNEWIQSWEGSGALEIESLLRGKDETNIRAFVDTMVGKGTITREGACEDLKIRLESYSKRLDRLDLAARDDAAKWYTLVMSRAAYLGKDWDYAIGIVPFFDMLNHCHDPRKSNTDLMSFGSCIDKSGTEDKENNSVVRLERKDFLLVLSKDVDQGDELLTEYATDIENEETQLKLWIQYGIPPP